MPYLGKQSEQVGVSIQKYEFLQATDTSSGTTSFSVPSDSGDHVNVWLNGVLLVEGGSDDYSKSNTAVTFNSAPADGDIVRIDVVESFALPDALKSSGDTMSGALKLDGGIKQQTSADLSGTYADHQVMLSDSYSVTGDVTISDNLVLAKISDDSNAVSLTNDTSTRTITGTGSLEASTLVQTPNASLTGMTGTVGSGVTIGSAVTFPTGKILQVKQYADATLYTSTDPGGWAQGPYTSAGFITLKSSSNSVLIECKFLGYNTRNSGTGMGSRYAIYRDSVSGTRLTQGSEPQFYAASGGEQYHLGSLSFLDTTPGSTTPRYSLNFNMHPSNDDGGSGNAQIYGTFATTYITLFEIQA
jgi:hypothetical protein